MTLRMLACHLLSAALCKDPAERPTVLSMVHHPWIELYRARRSMRQLNIPTTTSAADDHSAASASTTSNGSKLAGKHSVTSKHLATPMQMQRIADSLADCEDELRVQGSGASEPANMITQMGDVSLRSQAEFLRELQAHNAALKARQAAGECVDPANRSTKVQFAGST